MHTKLTTSFLFVLALVAGGLGAWSTSVQAQPYWFSGTVTTPSGDPIQGARVWFVYIGAPNQGVTEATTNSQGKYSAMPFMPFQYDIRLGIEKEGYEFSPVDYVIPRSAQNVEFMTRNFTGIKLESWTSGQSRDQHLLSGEMTYGYVDIPPGAVEWKVFYSGLGNPVIVPVFNSWPPPPGPGKADGDAKDPGFKTQLTEQTITINASSNPPIQAGKWYIGVFADEETTFTLSTRLTSADPDPTISGHVLDSAGDPVAGATVTGTNGTDEVQTDAQGAYTLTVPYYWTGVLSATLNGGQFAPFDRTYSAMEVSEAGVYFQGLKYPLTINSLMGDVSGAGWYDDGQTATWSLTNYLPDGVGTRWIAAPAKGQETMDAARTIDVAWYRQHRLTTVVEPFNSGVVSPQTSWIYETMSADVAAGIQGDWTFTGFTGDLTGLDSPQTITMNAPKTVIAHFTSDNPPPLPGDINVPGDYGTIQEAIDAAEVGDEIYVQPGTYTENIDFKGKDIVLRSYDPLDPDIVAETIIDGTSPSYLPVVKFAGTESADCRLQGFTIANATCYYGGIEGNGTLACIEYNVITNNELFYIYPHTGSGNGGGVHDCDGVIAYNTITGNKADGAGGGLAYCDGAIHHNTISANAGSSIYTGAGLWLCNADIDGNIITANVGTGILESSDGAVISNCLIYNNTGSGISSSTATIVNCTIVGNNTPRSGGGGIFGSGGSTVTNCIIWGNMSQKAASDPAWQNQVYFPGSLANCCIQNWTETANGCFADAPDLVNLATYDLRLTEDSPCIDTGAATSVAFDYRAVTRPFDGDGAGAGATGDGSDFDIGAYEYATSTPLAAPTLATEPPVTPGMKNTLEWSEVADAISYRIECAIDDSFTTPDLVMNVNAPVLTGTFKDLNDETYSYRVCAVDQVGTWGAWSNVVTSTQDATLPAFGIVSANPPVAAPGTNVDISFIASEALTANPVVTVNGHEALFIQIDGMYHHYRYTMSKYDPKGAATIKITGDDLAGLSGVSIVSNVLTRPPSTDAQGWLFYD